jgi:Ca-activated chloride channel family protein
MVCCSQRAAVGVFAVFAAQVAVAQAPPFRAEVDLVRLSVAVLDDDGEPVAGLAAGDFEVLEDGVPQAVASFVEGPLDAAAGEYALGDTSLHLGLMLDTSGSMEQDLTAASNAAARFVSTLTEASDITVVDFDTGLRIGRYVPASYPQLFERIRSLRPGRGTILYDAIARYVERALSRDGFHILVVYSDGGDSMSSLTLGDLTTTLRYGNVLIYAVGYMSYPNGSRLLRQQSVLTRIAEETGGQAFFPGSIRDLDRVYATIRAAILGRYTIGYVPSDSARDGRFRRIDVRLVGSDLEDARVRTRSGYIAVSSRP